MSSIDVHWSKSFSQRPSWCDARMCLKQIKQGKVTGNKPALCVRSALQWLLFKQGSFIQKHYVVVLPVMIIVMCFICVGLRNVKILTDIDKLWIPKGGRLEQEMKFHDVTMRKFYSNNGENSENTVDQKEQINRGIQVQVTIQTPKKAGIDILTQGDLLLHANVMEDIAKLGVEALGVNWTMADLCFKPPIPTVKLDISAALSQWLGASSKVLNAELNAMMDQMNPCLIITSLDCFWDGAKPHGPHPPIKLLNAAKMFTIKSLPKEHLSWRNFDPAAVFDEIQNDFFISQFLDISSIKTTFERAGVGNGYQQRPCIDPFDKECPKTAPNSIDMDKLTQKFMLWNGSKTYLPQSVATSSPKLLKNFAQTLLRNNRSLLDMFLNDAERKELIRDVDYGNITTNGCPGLATNIVHWPEPMIMGGIRKNQDGKITKVEALQSVVMLISQWELYERFQDCTEGKPCNITKADMQHELWTPQIANEILSKWQRKFVDFVYTHGNNNVADGTDRQLHPLAGTSVEDMLKEFSRFKPYIIIIGYALMLVYAGFCLFSLQKKGVHSCTGLAVAGVLLVTFSSVSGLGFCTFIGIQFNAATTQIVPFLTLGLGVDDMFLLVHNYKAVAARVSQDELGFLLKETGLSVLLTSISNILAFFAGSLISVPAMRHFCLQTAILLFFNVIAVLTVYPAMMAVDISRRKSKRLDVLCCIKLKKKRVQNGSWQVSPSTAVSQEKKKKHEWLQKISLQNFVVNIYGPALQKLIIKIDALVFFTTLLAVSIYGVTNLSYGLDLTDVIPKGTASYSFLDARQKYFSFYPIYITMKGEEIDFPNQQQDIKNLHADILKSKYIVTTEAKLGENWVTMMQDYIKDLQHKYDKALENGKNIGEKVDSEVRLAYQLICNTGPGVNCSRNIGNGTRLIDASGQLNTEGFYKYLTVWTNMDSMMYYVSQAEFFPMPPSWKQNSSDLSQSIPEAHPPLVSQIPFFMNGLVDTTATVDAIKEIRSVCDNYTKHGLPVFPRGIPFTFWEQYLHLTDNLLKDTAIIVGCVFVVITLLLMSPWTAVIVVGILLMMVVELCGYMGLLGLKLNPVSAVSLITAVGIGVEFTVHMSFSFLTTLGTRNERMAKTLEHMFVPVTHGGISTLLGIVMLAFSEFDFIVRYFFMVMAGLILIGLLNGLILLPVILALIGPGSEVQTLYGNCLPTPPPKGQEEVKNPSNLNGTGVRLDSYGNPAVLNSN